MKKKPSTITMKISGIERLNEPVTYRFVKKPERPGDVQIVRSRRGCVENLAERMRQDCLTVAVRERRPEVRRA